MENKSITFTIPLIPAVLRSMADMLRNLADGDSKPITAEENDEWRAEFEEWKKQNGKKPEAGTKPITAEATNGGWIETGGHIKTDNGEALTPDAGTAPPPPAGVELADGIPWDARIHSSGKTKYKKAPYGWVRRKNISDELFEQVEAELRAVMDIPPPSTDEATTAADAFGIADVDPACEGCNRGPAECAACKAVSAAPKACPTSFMELNVAITTSGTLIAPEMIEAAVKKAGLPSYAVLSTRPDLIPQIAKELGLC